MNRLPGIDLGCNCDFAVTGVRAAFQSEDTHMVRTRCFYWFTEGYDLSFLGYLIPI